MYSVERIGIVQLLTVGFKATTLTITDCPCTRTKVYTTIHPTTPGTVKGWVIIFPRWQHLTIILTSLALPLALPQSELADVALALSLPAALTPFTPTAQSQPPSLPLVQVVQVAIPPSRHQPTQHSPVPPTRLLLPVPLWPVSLELSLTSCKCNDIYASNVHAVWTNGLTIACGSGKRRGEGIYTNRRHLMGVLFGFFLVSYIWGIRNGPVEFLPPWR